MACCASCAQNLPCETGCDHNHGTHGDHHHGTHADHHDHGTYADADLYGDGLWAATDADDDTDPLTGLSLSDWRAVEEAALSAWDSGSESAWIAAARRLGFDGNALGEGVAFLQGYADGRSRAESYAAALAVSFAQGEVIDQDGNLTEDGIEEISILVDGQGDEEEVAQYLTIRAQVDAELSRRCGGLSREACLNAGEGVYQALADALRRAAVASPLALPLFTAPPPEGVTLAPLVDQYPEGVTSPQGQAAGGGVNSSPPTAPPPSPSPKNGFFDRLRNRRKSPDAAPSAAPKTGAEKMAEDAKGNKTAPRTGESPAQARARADREAARAAAFGLHDLKALPASGGPRAQLAASAPLPVQIEKEEAPRGFERFKKIATVPLNIGFDHKGWVELERAFRARGTLDLAALNRVHAASPRALKPLAHAYLLGRVRYERHLAALQTPGSDADRLRVASGLGGTWRGLTAQRSVVTGPRGRVSTIPPSEIFDASTEAGLWQTTRSGTARLLAGKRGAALAQAFWSWARTSGNGALIPPPPTAGHWRALNGLPATAADDDAPGFLARVRGLFMAPTASLEELDEALMPATECGCATGADEADFGLYDDPGATADDGYGYGDPLYSLDQIGALAADLSDRDKEIAAQLTQKRADALTVARACFGGDTAACKRGFDALPGLARTLAGGAGLSDADDPARVALVVVKGAPEGPEDKGILEKLEALIDKIQADLQRPGAWFDKIAADFQGQWAALRGWLEGLVNWIDPRAWFDAAGNDPEVLPPTNADEEDEWTSGQIAALTIAAAIPILLAGGAMATYAYTAPTIVPALSTAYGEVLGKLAENADDIIQAAIPSRALIAAGGQALGGRR
jgi:hypothetical protein